MLFSSFAAPVINRFSRRASGEWPVPQEGPYGAFPAAVTGAGPHFGPGVSPPVFSRWISSLLDVDSPELVKPICVRPA